MHTKIARNDVCALFEVNSTNTTTNNTTRKNKINQSILVLKFTILVEVKRQNYEEKSIHNNFDKPNVTAQFFKENNSFAIFQEPSLNNQNKGNFIDEKNENQRKSSIPKPRKPLTLIKEDEAKLTKVSQQSDSDMSDIEDDEVENKFPGLDEQVLMISTIISK